MRSFISWAVYLVIFCWGICSALSILSELKFLVDGWDWSISHVAISFQAILRDLARQVSEGVSGYREVVRGLVRVLGLPVYPRYVYDCVGIIVFSLCRGFWFVRRELSLVIDQDQQWDNPPTYLESISQASKWVRPTPVLYWVASRLVPRILTYSLIARGNAMYSKFNDLNDPPGNFTIMLSRDMLPFTALFALIALLHLIVYTGVIAIGLSLLFSIDYLYRHFITIG